MLSPEAPKLSLASYNWSLVSAFKSLLSVKELGKLHILFCLGSSKVA
jgi:hypothetical protein